MTCGVNRVDYPTALAVKFFRQKYAEPFFLVFPQLEPRQQNGERDEVAIFDYALSQSQL